MRQFVSLVCVALVAGCTAAGSSTAGGPSPAGWQITLGKPPPGARGSEALPCTASLQMTDGTFIEIAERSDGLTLGIVRPGAKLSDAAAASITLAGMGGSTSLPARSLSGGMMIAVLGSADASRRIIAAPFRLTARMGEETLVDGTLPAVSSATAAPTTACFAAAAAG